MSADWPCVWQLKLSVKHSRDWQHPLLYVLSYKTIVICATQQYFTFCFGNEGVKWRTIVKRAIRPDLPSNHPRDDSCGIITPPVVHWQFSLLGCTLLLFSFHSIHPLNLSVWLQLWAERTCPASHQTIIKSWDRHATTWSQDTQQLAQEEETLRQPTRLTCQWVDQRLHTDRKIRVHILDRWFRGMRPRSPFREKFYQGERGRIPRNQLSKIWTRIFRSVCWVEDFKWS